METCLVGEIPNDVLVVIDGSLGRLEHGLENWIGQQRDVPNVGLCESV